jgi:hypothetical protein
MFKHKSLILTICIFLLWFLTGATGSWLVRLMIDVIQPVSLGVIVALISWIELGIKLVGTYVIARQFLPQPMQKTKHLEREETSDEVLFHPLEEEQKSVKQRQSY